MVRLEISGRISKDPEVRDAGQTRIAKVSVAVTVPDRDGQGVLFLDLKGFPPIADQIGKLRKGDQVYAICTGKTNKWTAKDGSTKYSTEWWPVFMSLLPKKAAPAPAAAGEDLAPAATAAEAKEEEDDVPF